MQKSSSVRVRFAPSPTGYLHVGGARTALFNFLFARSQQGQFLVRIEDTDAARSESSLTESIFQSLKWLGFSWDESPVFQSRRIPRYIEICQQLLETGHAYRCFCSAELLESKREIARKAGIDTRYDRICLELSKNDIQRYIQNKTPHSIRFHVRSGETCFDDLIHGSVSIQNTEIEDFIILRSDGTPVYQIAVITDDHDMSITHVIRGDDHLSNTPKQVLLYQAMGWNPPQFGHVPLILGTDKKRLSKRHGATSVEAYRDQGILPEALNNFLALLGWSPGDDREIMDMETMIRLFSLERISKKSAVFDIQKLEWMNSAYISSSTAERLFAVLCPALQQACWIGSSISDEEKTIIFRVIDLLKTRMKTPNDFIPQASYFFDEPSTYDEAAVQKHWSRPDISEWLTMIMTRLSQCQVWDALTLEQLIRQTAEEMQIGAGRLIHPIRLALTGSGSSPGLFEVMELLGKERVMKRIGKAIEYISKIDFSK